MIGFLKHHIFNPLKARWFYENRARKDNPEEQEKGRMLLSVAVTKILIKFPLQIFLHEFQRVLIKMSRLLKKKDVNVRNSARKCLSEIAKIVGP